MDADFPKGYSFHVTIYPAKKTEQRLWNDMREKGIIIYFFDLKQVLLQ
jgi:hypothetical protein